MATVTKSAAQAAADLFASVTVTANAVSTLVGAAGAAFDALDDKAKLWRDSVRLDARNERIKLHKDSGSRLAQELVLHAEELETFFGKKEGRKQAYAQALEYIETYEAA